MNASQVAALGDLPENQPRRVFLLRRMHTAITLCHGCFPLPALADYGSFLCFHDRIFTTQAAVSGITGACDVRHSRENANHGDTETQSDSDNPILLLLRAAPSLWSTNRNYGPTPPLWQSEQFTAVKSPMSTGCLKGWVVSAATWVLLSCCSITVWHELQSLLITLPSLLTWLSSWQRKQP